jgi:hypothetical protein
MGGMLGGGGSSVSLNKSLIPDKIRKRPKPVRMPYAGDKLSKERVQLALKAQKERKGRASTRLSSLTQKKMKV